MSNPGFAPRAHPRADPSARIASIDLIRGAVMILMALDHVRVFSGMPAGGPTPGIFFTRWITHFCAPAFVFLAGTSAFLNGRRRPGLARNLVSRGTWLVFLELTILRLAWTFNLDFAYLMAGVLWAIGWCMILLAGVVRLAPRTIGILGSIVIVGHNLLDPHLGGWIPTLGDGPWEDLWRILYVGFFAGPVRFGENGPTLMVLYSIVPWIGVMAAGYAFGALVILEPARRKRLCLAIGLGTTALFLVLRGFDLYGDPRPWREPRAGVPSIPAVLAFLNTSKYPASFDFLLMTLGPTIALIPFLERMHGTLARWITIFGRVPLFYYLLHIPLIHALALVVSHFRQGEVNGWLFTNHPMGAPPAPPGYTWSLALLYAMWLLSLVALYFPCRWFESLAARRRAWWSGYL